jgi:predicted lipoprotein
MGPLPGSSRSRVALPALAMALMACGGGGNGSADARIDGDAPGASFDRRALLARLANQFLIPTYERFVTQADGLATALDTYCAALASPPAGDPAATRAAAQAAWRSTIDVWQLADAVLVDPGAMEVSSVANRIYSWPLVSTCNLDRDTAARFQSPATYDIETRFDNARSLAAVEYLLFVGAGADHTCPTAPDGWSSVVFSLPKARCDLAAVIADDVAAQGRRLLALWKPEGGNYLARLTEAGTDGSPLSAQEAVNLVSDSLFYVDKMTKDMKLGEPAGILLNSCPTAGQPCLAEVEHLYAVHGKEAILANLQALRIAFTGTIDGADGPGFDDFLNEVGATDLSTRMVGKIDAAIVAVQAIPGGLNDALVSSPDQVRAAHAAVKTFTDDMKSQFLTVLGLDIPDDVAGDND